MLIIVEGPDGSGKTTLCNELERQLHNEVGAKPIIRFEAGPPQQHPLNEYETSLLEIDYRPNGNHHVICDRWHLGEAVYPQLLGRKTRWNIAIARHISLFLRSRGALVVYVESTRDRVAKSIAERSDATSIDRFTLGAWCDVVSRFREQVRLSGLATYETPSEFNTEEVAREVITSAKNIERIKSDLNQFITYVGPRFPKALLFGDQRNRPPLQNSPAFGPYPSTSGSYLLSHLDVQGFNSIGLANACDVDDPVAIYETLDKPRVIALGTKAGLRCTKVGIRHVTVEHPQFMRRFHHKDGAEYASRIQYLIS